MLSKRFFGMKKNAEITIEVTLSVALLIVVLFLTIGLFSDNLQTMAANCGMQNLFNKEKSIEKTTYQHGSVNAAKTQINVQVVAEQGHDWYLTQAQDAITKYKENPPTTEAQIQDLAKAATIAKLLGVLDDADRVAFYKAYKIDIQTENGITLINNKNITYTIYNSSDKLTVVKEVTVGSFS